MNCLDYRQLLTSDPAHRGAEAQKHRLQCRSCAAFAGDMQQFDRQLRDAMTIPTPRGLEERVILAATGQARSRRRWYSIAAGAVLGLAVSFGILYQRDSASSLQASVVDHIYHEAGLLVPSSTVIAQPKLAGVLQQAGIRLVGDPGNVSYAGLCYFRGQLVPHMVVRGESGPVTVLVLKNEHVDEAVAIDEEGFAGTIIPVNGGSIAVVGSKEEKMDTVRRRVVDAMEWEI